MPYVIIIIIIIIIIMIIVTIISISNIFYYYYYFYNVGRLLKFFQKMFKGKKLRSNRISDFLPHTCKIQGTQ